LLHKPQLNAPFCAIFGNLRQTALHSLRNSRATSRQNKQRKSPQKRQLCYIDGVGEVKIDIKIAHIIDKIAFYRGKGLA